MIHSTQAIGSNIVPLTPIPPSKLYWGACIPKLCYGIELQSLSNETVMNLEQFHINAT